MHVASMTLADFLNEDPSKAAPRTTVVSFSEYEATYLQFVGEKIRDLDDHYALHGLGPSSDDVALMHEGQFAGFYHGTILVLDEQHRDLRLSVPLILEASKTRADPDPRTLTDAGRAALAIAWRWQPERALILGPKEKPMKVRVTNIRPIGDDSSPELSVHLVLASGEDYRADEVQREFAQANAEFREGAQKVNPRVYAQRSDTGGSWFVGQWILQLVSALGVSGALTAFLTRHNGRRVRIKIGEFEAEATNPKELEKVVEQALEVKRTLETRGGE